MIRSRQKRREIAARALSLVDLTNLADDCDAASITALAARGQTAHGPVAALCVWPQFVEQAAALVRGTGIKIATVVNFPRGGDDVETVLAETRSAVTAGATEIDLVWPYHAFLEGREDVCATMIRRVRAVMPADLTLKVILETGELASVDRISRASKIALLAGADMLKTSTGKVSVGATIEAANAMITCIRDADSSAGFKASGGVANLDDAANYLDLADTLMGPGWAQVETFRFGASSLVGALLSELDAPDDA